MNKKKILVAVLICVGVGLIFYPILSSILAYVQEEEVIAVYEKSLDEYSEEEVEEEMAKAKEYNDNISGENIKDPFMKDSGFVLPENYDEILDYDGVMGYIEIPEIKVKLPIFHGTSDEVLGKGAGHLPQSSFPVGGVSTHAVISAHSGLPSATLFTNLNNLVEGDVFYIHVLNDTLKYEVDDISVVEPYETSSLLQVAGEDYVTLVTCTPYGVNSHRLLVRGTRVDYEEEHTETVDLSAKTGNNVLWALLIILLILVIALVIAVIRYQRRRK
ncbi:MAG: class C sortase [Suipraeoptans sp.]